MGVREGAAEVAAQGTVAAAAVAAAAVEVMAAVAAATVEVMAAVAAGMTRACLARPCRKRVPRATRRAATRLWWRLRFKRTR